MGRPEAKSAWTAISWAVAAAVVVTAVAMMASIAGRAGEPAEALSPLTLAVATGGTVLAVVGASVLATSRSRDVALVSAMAAMLVIAALLALFSVGMLILPAAIVMLVLLARRASGRRGLLVALLAGPAVAVGVTLLLVIWVQPPLVECHQHGVSQHSRPWWSSGSGSGSAELSPLGVATGSIETPSGHYVYRCEGSRLAEFRRDRRQ